MGSTGSNPVRYLLEVVRMDEDLVLKTSGAAKPLGVRFPSLPQN